MTTQPPAWQRLAERQQATPQFHMHDLFAADINRFDAVHETLYGLLFDYNKNRIIEKTLALLCNLANSAQVRQRMQAICHGGKTNTSENRALLHITLHLSENTDPIMVDGENVVPKVHTELNCALSFTGNIIDGSHTGITDERVTDLAYIGVGGSDLGPQMGVQALCSYRTGVCAHFISNSDDAGIAQTLAAFDPETAIPSIASKPFDAPETLLNRQATHDRHLQYGLSEEGISHYFCVTFGNVGATVKFGIPPECVSGMFDRVGGRYSIWSATGFPMMVTAGSENFREPLRGAHAMDEHFFSAEFRYNILVLMALLDVWYNNFYHSDGHITVPYSYNMRRFTTWLNQLDTESCDKQRTIDDKPVNCTIGDIIFGKEGPSCQHAYSQPLRQGTRLIPADFIVPVITPYGIDRQNRLTVTDTFARAEALVKGKALEEVRAELSALSEVERRKLALQEEFPSNRPSNSLLFGKLDPFSLGMLTAAYEHRTFVQDVVWSINPSDQWGVEYSKILAGAIEPELENGTSTHDSPTNGLVAFYRRYRKQRPGRTGVH